MEELLHWSRELLNIVQEHNYLAMYLLLTVEEGGVPLPLPGDTVVAYAGYMARMGEMIWWLILLVAVGASVTGSLPLYWLTKARGRPLVYRYGKYMHLTPNRTARIENWLRRHGGMAVFVGRLIPGMRVGTTAVAGVFEIPFWQFLGYLTASAIVWWGFWLWLGATVGIHLKPLVSFSPVHFIMAVGGIMVVASIVLYLRHFGRGQLPTPPRIVEYGGEGRGLVRGPIAGGEDES